MIEIKNFNHLNHFDSPQPAQPILTISTFQNARLSTPSTHPPGACLFMAEYLPEKAAGRLRFFYQIRASSFSHCNRT
jgi:hypothetical protein